MLDVSCYEQNKACKLDMVGHSNRVERMWLRVAVVVVLGRAESCWSRSVVEVGVASTLRVPAYIRCRQCTVKARFYGTTSRRYIRQSLLTRDGHRLLARMLAILMCTQKQCNTEAHHSHMPVLLDMTGQNADAMFASSMAAACGLLSDPSQAKASSYRENV